MEIRSVGFIGTGVMGRSMAGHVLDAGHRLVVFNRTKAKAEDLLARGAEWRDTPGEVASDVDVVVTMVGYPADVEAVYLGEGGVVERAREGALLVDMTTSSPDLARRIAEEAAARGLRALDAPVSGGDVGARDAKLTIMVGGDENDFRDAEQLLRCMGTNVIRQGGPGAGQHTKMANQIAVASSMLGLCESLAYAEHAGLDPARVLDSIGAGAAGSWSLTNYAPRIFRGDFAPGFYVKHFIKDMRIAIDAAREMQLRLPMLDLACNLYEQLAEDGHAEDGTQALWKLYEGEGPEV